jgi:hypothetical protein
VCGRAGVMEWCHIRSRRYKATRWEPRNAFSAHHNCHMDTHHPTTASKTFFANLVSTHEMFRLTWDSLNLPPPDPFLLEYRLKLVLKSYSTL